MEKMKIGDKISAPLFPRGRSREFEEGKVVFIHPRKRFFTLEFVTASGTAIRESYHPAGPLGCTEQKETPVTIRTQRKAS